MMSSTRWALLLAAALAACAPLRAEEEHFAQERAGAGYGDGYGGGGYGDGEEQKEDWGWGNGEQGGGRLGAQPMQEPPPPEPKSAEWGQSFGPLNLKLKQA